MKGAKALSAESIVDCRPRRGVLAVAALCASLTALSLASVTPASAALKYQQSGQFANSFNFLTANSVAPNDHNGHIYVADSGNGHVLNFTSPSDTSPTVWNGSTTPASSFGGGHVAVAVDNSNGDVYVADGSNKVIDKFDENGNLITSFGDSTPSPNGQLAGTATPAASFNPAASYASFPIAVDQATHDLYVADANHEVVDIFDQDGAYLRQIVAPPGLFRSQGGYVIGVAVEATTGNVYVADWAGPNVVFEFDSSGNYVKTLDGSNTPDGNFSGTCTGCSLISVATEDSTGKVFVGAMGHSNFDVFDSLGNFIPPQGVFPGFGPSGIAVDQSNGTVYLSSYGGITIFKPAIVPDVTANPASNLTATDATVSGHFDPAGGGDVTDCHFEYITNNQYARDNQQTGANPWQNAQQAPCTTTPASSPPYPSPTDVSATLSGLSPGTLYHYRLVAANANGSNSSDGQVFTTVGTYHFSSDVGSAGAGAGQLSNPQDVAVDSSNGDVYVADTGNHRVVKFDSSGNFISAWGWGVSDGNASSEVCTSGCQAGIAGSGAGQFTTPRFVEVDNSGGPSAGDVYVADTADGVVQKFDPSGNLITGWGSGGAIDRSKDGTIGGITVDTLGNLFVVNDDPPYYWTEIGQDSVFQTQTGTEGNSLFNLGAPYGTGIDISSTGAWYEIQQPSNGGSGVLYSGPTATTYDVFPVYNSPVATVNSGLTIDRSTNDLYVDQGDHIDQFTVAGCSANYPPGCNLSDVFGSGNLNAAAGLAINPSTGVVYAANAGDNNVAVFSPLPFPKVTTNPVTNLGPTSATLTGHVDPHGAGDITDCHFDYGTDNTYSLGSVPCSPGTPLSSPTDVSASLTGLTPFDIYHYRLVATGTNDLGISTQGHDRSFSPTQGSAPGVDATSFSDLASTTVTLGAQINPNLAPTIYTFQYGTDTSYGSATIAGDSIGSDSVDHAVSNAVSDLQPGTNYHFRVVAVNLNGVVNGPDRTFTTPAVPAVAGTAASDVTETTAKLSASIRPGFRPTTYHFEYGLTDHYGSSTPESASIGSDNSVYPASASIAGLSPLTLYHFRVVATNAIGTTDGPDQTFATASTPPVVTPPPPTCKAGFVLRHGKCVKPHHHKPRHHKRKHHRRSH